MYGSASRAITILEIKELRFLSHFFSHRKKYLPQIKRGNVFIAHPPTFPPQLLTRPAQLGVVFYFIFPPFFWQSIKKQRSRWNTGPLFVRYSICADISRASSQNNSLVMLIHFQRNFWHGFIVTSHFVVGPLVSTLAAK